MKKYLFLFLIFSFQFLTAQWEPTVRLTNDPGNSSISDNNARCIAANGNTVHIVWYDDRDGNKEIYYKNSIDCGLTWGLDRRLTNDIANSIFPSIALSDSFIHVVWTDDRDGNKEIYYKRSTDGGFSWEPDIRLTYDNALSDFPSIAVFESDLHVVWRDNRDGNDEIYYKHSSDNGLSWGLDLRLTNNDAESLGPSVSVSGPFVHVTWRDARDGSLEIYYKRSTNGGNDWETDKRLSGNYVYASASPSIAVSGSMVYVIYVQQVGRFNYYIEFRRSTDSGFFWEGSHLLSYNINDSKLPCIAVSGSVVHAIWLALLGPWKLIYKRSQDGGLTWESNVTLSSSSVSSSSIAISDSIVHVLWYDDTAGNNEIYYKRNPNGNPVGIKIIDPEIPEEFSLSQNYPNPFNPTTIISWQSPVGSWQTLKVYDILGNEIATLVDEYREAGSYEVEFNVAQVSKPELPSGIYLYKLTAGKFSTVRKMMLIK